MRIAIGIDPGASCGVAAVTERHAAWTTCALPGWRTVGCPVEAWAWHVEALSDALACVLGHLEAGGDVTVILACEDSRHARGHGHAAAAGWQHALVASVARQWGLAPIMVAPSTWQWGLVGEQGRDAYVAHARAMVGEDVPHDEAAALCMAEWAWQQQWG